MKHTIYGIALAIIMIVTLATCMVVSGRGIRQNEIDRTLDTTVEQTVAKLLKKENLLNVKQFMADFAQGLALKVASDSELEVQVAGQDVSDGLLGVKVISHYIHPNGKPGKVETERNVLLEQYQQEKKKRYTIAYKIGTQDYKVYTLTEGSQLPVPVTPEGNFISWTDETGIAVKMEAMTANQNRSFYAKMN
ncbi:MAG: hypothetical protein RSF88_06175 [Lachnospiraceae bacterium]